VHSSDKTCALVLGVLGMTVALLVGCQAASNRSHALLVDAHYTLRSRINERDYRISVSLPRAYETADRTSYPVVYLLDGTGKYYSLMVRVQRLLEDRLPPVIWVGIGSPSEAFAEGERTADTTPTNRPAYDDIVIKNVAAELAAASDAKPVTEEMKYRWRSGQADTFLHILREDIMPFVETRYRTQPELRTLAGHSFSGLFAANVLLTEPGLFQRYWISSPSLWWDDEIILEQEARYSEQHNKLPARVYVSVGASENATMTEPNKRFVENITKRGYAGLALKHRVFPDHDHMSVIVSALTEGMSFLLGEN
jgi:predicted alpha/beta superfamily hydrolase